MKQARLRSVPMARAPSVRVGPGALMRPSAARGGNPHRWRKVAKAFLMRHPLCRGCAAAGMTRPAEVVDHVIPHRGDRRLFWDRGNWQPLCKWHHDSIKARLEARWDRGAVTAEDLDMASPAAIEETMRVLRGAGSNP